MSLELSYGVNKDRKIYGNCQVVSKDDILMFRCDKKRADWYLKTIDNKTGESIGELINENPYTVRLRFEPKGLGNHNKEFGLTEMANKCVSCGTEEYLTRHHVVPYCYRKFLPESIKSHNFHDVLPLCVKCHSKYERSADKLKEQLAIDYKAPINGEMFENKDLIKYSKIANTLLFKDDIEKLPKSRIRRMRNIIKDGLGINRLTKERLLELSKVKTTVIKRTHGEIVMSNITDIQIFIEAWRDHFINNNDCSFLPEKWSVKTKVVNG